MTQDPLALQLITMDIIIQTKALDKHRHKNYQ